jgi:hypothetical protein
MLKIRDRTYLAFRMDDVQSHLTVNGNKRLFAYHLAPINHSIHRL